MGQRKKWSIVNIIHDSVRASHGIDLIRLVSQLEDLEQGLNNFLIRKL